MSTTASARVANAARLAMPRADRRVCVGDGRRGDMPSRMRRLAFELTPVRAAGALIKARDASWELSALR